VILIPDLLGEVLADEGFGASGELRPSLEVLWGLEVSTAGGAARFAGGLGDTLGRVAAH